MAAVLTGVTGVGSRSRAVWVMMVPVTTRPVPAPMNGMDGEDRATAVARLHDLFAGGEVSFDAFSEALDKLFDAPDHAGLAEVMLALPPLVRMTPAWLRLAKPLVLRAADGRLQLGPGWQLAGRTTVSTGPGAARLDLTAASWDAHQIDLRLETWGSIDVVVPAGVAVQVAGGSRPVQLRSVAPPVPGGPTVRVSTNGPAGVIRVCHPEAHDASRSVRWRRLPLVHRNRNSRALAAAGHTR